MAVQTPTYFVNEYANILKLLLQQEGSRIRGSVMEKEHVGQQASPVDQVGQISMSPVVGRFTPMGRVDAPADRRWVFPSEYDLPQLVDPFDELEMIIDPKGKYVQNAVAAAGRQVDQVLLNAFFGTNYTGQNAGTSVTFPAGQKIAKNFSASSNVGLTVAKIREFRRLLMAANLDMNEADLHLVFSATQHDNLLAEAQVISLDFNDKPVLVDGMIKGYLGVKFHFTQLGPYNNTTVRQVMGYDKSGVHLGIWQNMQTKISQRDDLSGIPWQIYLKLMIGATRLEEKRCVWIDCQE